MELTTPTVTDMDTEEAQLVPRAVWALRGQSWAESRSVGLQRGWPPAPIPFTLAWVPGLDAEEFAGEKGSGRHGIQVSLPAAVLAE